MATYEITFKSGKQITADTENLIVSQTEGGGELIQWSSTAQGGTRLINFVRLTEVVAIIELRGE